MKQINDLFFGGDELEKLAMQGADVSFSPQISLPFDLQVLLKKLIDTIPWRAEKVTVWGKKFDQPRLIAWFGEEGKSYTYSGIHMNPNPWTSELLALKGELEKIVQVEFNSVLLNYYRDERDSMGFHSDDEKELGSQPVIASLSLGEERTFVFKHKRLENLKIEKIKLTSGSLLVMKGDTQKNWKHGIEKESQPCGPRVNLTFRRIFHDLKSKRVPSI